MSGDTACRASCSDWQTAAVSSFEGSGGLCSLSVLVGFGELHTQEHPKIADSRLICFIIETE